MQSKDKRQHKEMEMIQSRNEFRPDAGSRVLVVEDDIPLAELLRQQLEAESYAVTVLHDGESARTAIPPGRFDLVILDLNLPQLDGVSLLKQVRPSVPRLPVLVLTARNRVEDRALSLDTGADDLMSALNGFDNSKQVQFQTYARFRIRGAILDSLRKLDWASRPLRAKGRQITTAVAELIAILGRQPSEQEIADHLGMPLAKLQKLVAEIDGLTLLGQEAFTPYDPSESQDLIENAPSRGDDDPFTQCLHREVHGRLSQSITQLTGREQLLLSLYYKEELTMREVAEIIGVRQSRASQIHSMILLKLRASLAPLQAPPLAGVAAQRPQVGR